MPSTPPATYFQHHHIKPQILTWVIPGAVQSLSFAEKGTPEPVSATSRPWIVDHIVGQKYSSCSIETIVTDDMEASKLIVSDPSLYEISIPAVPPATAATRFHLSEYAVSIKGGQPITATYSFMTPDMPSPEWWTTQAAPSPDKVWTGDKMAVVDSENASFVGFPVAATGQTAAPSGVLSMDASVNLNLTPVQVSDSSSPAWFTVTYPVDILLTIRSIIKMTWPMEVDIGETHSFKLKGARVLPSSQAINVGGFAEFVLTMTGFDMEIPDLLSDPNKV